MSAGRVVRAVVLLGLVAFLASGCRWTGLNSLSLPFTKGGGQNDVEITVQLRNATNLVPNSEVRYHDVLVGAVRRIALDHDWVANLTVDLEASANVPADVIAKVAQKSLLGAEYLDLSDPPRTTAARPMRSGSVVGLDRSGRYPETEEVLAGAATLLNGGGLPQIRTIAHELNAAIGGRTGDIKAFLRTVREFTGELDVQRRNIVRTLEKLDRLSREVVRNRSKIDRALTTLPAGFELLAQERKKLVATLRALDRFGKVTRQVVGGTKADLQANLDNLRPVTRALAQNSQALSESFDTLGFPFGVRTANNITYGDYMNLITEIDVSAGDISKDWLGGTPLDGLFNGAIPGSPVGPAGQAANPLTDLLPQLTNGLLGGH